MALTKAFKSRLHLEDHFANHGARLGTADQQEYLARADAFLGGPKSKTAQECRRPWNNDLVRFDPATDEYGVMDKDGYIKTYYQPDPEEHGFKTNGEYFRYERSRAI